MKRFSLGSTFDAVFTSLTLLLAVHGAMNVFRVTPLSVTLPAGLICLVLLWAIVAYDRRQKKDGTRA